MNEELIKNEIFKDFEECKTLVEVLEKMNEIEDKVHSIYLNAAAKAIILKEREEYPERYCGIDEIDDEFIR